MKDETVFESLARLADKVLTNICNFFAKDRVTAIIPAYNEEKTVRGVIGVVKKAKVDEIIVVDDGSKDRTFQEASVPGVRVIRHRVNKGKGAAMRTGVKEAAGNILAFIDGDLKSLTIKGVNSLIDPILKNEADFVKSYFSHYKSKTSRSIFLYKPLVKHLFNSTGFVHPMSGQIAGRKRFFDSIEFRDDYGADISILIDAIKHNLRIKEVCLGRLSHKKKKAKDVEATADTVIETILEKAEITRPRQGF